MKSSEIPDYSTIRKTVLERAVAREIARGRTKETGLTFNYDPISAETYRRIFNKLIHPGDIVVNVGAGFAIDPTDGFNHLNREILDACTKKDATLIVADTYHSNLLTHQDLKELTKNVNLQVVEANGLQMPITDASVAGMVSGNLINFPNAEMKLEEQANRLIEETYRILRPGGFILLSSFGYNIEGKDEEGRNVYNNELKKEDLLTLKRTEEILVSKGFTDVAELDIDPENEAIINKGYKSLPEERGGFIAYKPRH
ncbi:MAG: hypothetical protein A3G09_00595 [Candidatus Moranbacteria bacterium RIFCSPLOWO2_12_FULL_48_12]|nr:MAG: hypothetical protein A2772_00485 [Candidatus Daviesbacteria bacterium RIFCSPHIGHO2_01_FULL_38_8b]OGI29779.1 MAG: hypothetical protein A3G09_00595 [Candidatus Moranbacteria bacterium RIFCSPLOWO2_12_FULL_48_12]